MLKPPELPSTDFHDRLSRALSVWLESKGKVGQVGPQIALREAIRDLKYAVPSKGSVSEWIAGKKVPKLDHCFILALALGQPPAWLAFNDGEMVGARSEAIAQFHEDEPPGSAFEQKKGGPKKRAG